MDFGLSDDQREIQRTARELLAGRARPERVREHAEAHSTDAELWGELCGLGWPGIAVAERYGGQGLGSVELSILCEELGRVVAPVPFLASVLAATLIEHAGSQSQCERWLPGLASGDVVGAVGVAGGSGHDVGAVGVAGGRGHDVGAVGVAGGSGHDGGVVGVAGGRGHDGGVGGGGSGSGGAGVCELMVGAGDASLLVLLEGEEARVLNRADAEVTPLAAIDPTRSAARVSAPAGAGETLAGAALPGVERALVAIAAELVGVCDRALAMTVAYVKDRRQFGVPVGSFQAVAHRCAQMLLDTEKARSTTAFAAWTADADPGRLGEAAAMAKAAASDAGVDVTASAIQAHGGIGFTWEADVHWLYKRAQIDAALLGGAKHQRARLASLLAAG